MNTVGRYTIIKELGRGGMATVYLAHDPSFGRDVALKVLPREFLHDTTFLSRFQREARTIATLEHQAIVPVYDFGEQDGQPFLVMRYMTGGTLSRYILDGPLSLPETARILSQLARALDYAHSRGVVHRDLKPGNILFDDQENAFLSDFGIAKLAEATANLTGSAVIGTPAYMSPEQVHGQRNIDGRADIYTLGIILFQMLTGQLPYKADTPARQMMAHVLEPVPLVRQVRADLPEACDAIIKRAMAKNPNERFATAVDMAAALQDVTPTKPDRAPPTLVSAPETIGGKPTVVEEELPLEAFAAVESAVPATPPAALPAAAETEELPAPPQAPVDTWDGISVPQQRAPTPARRLSGWMWAVLGLVLVAAVVTSIALSGREPGDDLAVVNQAELAEGETAVALSEFIEAKWAEGFDVTSLAHGNGIWAVFMSQHESDAVQVWHAAANFPQAVIEERWAAGLDVTHLAYGNGRWVVTMARDEQNLRQTWQTSATFPIDWIEAKWAEGFDVSALAHGNGLWAVIMSQGVVDARQAWQTSADFPAGWVEAKWAEGFDITSLTYGHGVWAVIMSQGVGGARQNWHTSATFPADWIETKWGEGFDVTHLTYGDGRWLVVMAQGAQGSRQTWQTGRAFSGGG